MSPNQTSVPEIANPQAHDSKPGKTKVEKAQSYLALASTSIGILGAIGTAFVWLVTTFYIGTVEIKPDRPVETLQVRVVDTKGQQGTYFSKIIQLMPGTYHLQIGEPDKPAVSHLDVNVQLWKSAVISYAVPTSLQTPQAQDQSGAAAENSESGKKRWWQFWRKGTSEDAKVDHASDEPSKGEAQ